MFTNKSIRCKLFEDIAEEVWDNVSMQRAARVNPNETGITSRIIALIKTAFINDNHAGVWSNLAYKEHVNGGDIDVFVESQPNEFVWYSLQAKILKVNGRYTSMRHHSGYQWTKLRRLSRNGGCIPYFLLYNGDMKYKYTGIDICNRRFDEKQFGCSIVKLETIEQKSIDLNGVCSPPHFLDFHHQHAEPWRVLTCCSQPNARITYTIDQIQNYTEPYQLISAYEPLGMEREYSNFIGSESNQLANLTTELNHKPDFILLFRRTTFPVN